jgi:hypothetical protein
MKPIAAILASTTLALVALTAAPAAADPDPGTQLCVQNPDGTWFAYLAETPEDWAAIAGLRQEPFPNTVHGCASYGPLYQPPTPAAPAPAECPAPVVDLSGVVAAQRQTLATQEGTIIDLVADVNRKQRRIERLQAKIRALR